MTIAVNGRFLRARPSGMHRAARALIDAARASGMALEVLAPPGVDDARVDRVVRGPRGRLGDHAWEQAVLPLASRGHMLLSPTNTAPVLGPHNVVWVHDLAPIVGPHWFAPSMRAYALLVVSVARRARLVLAPSAAIADELVGIGVRSSDVAVVRTAIDRRFQPAGDHDVAAVRQRYRLERPYVVHVGGDDPRKDAVTAVAAHVAAVDRYGHDLVLLGRRHPTFSTVNLPSTPSVRPLGYVADAELPALLTGAGALLFPSHYEGFGLPPLEAMACGTPALVSDLPVLRESTWGLARYLPPGDVEAWTAGLLAVLDERPAAPILPLWSRKEMASQFASAIDSAAFSW